MSAFTFKNFIKLKENAIVGTTNNITKQGQPSAMKQGTLKLVDKQGQTLGTYQFRNGGGGRGFIPGGTYTVTGREPLAPSDRRPMTIGRVGYKYRVLTNNGSPSIPDPRYQEPRSGILIHPDGNVPGTMGCVGIVGDENVQADFVNKMDYLIQQGGGRYTFQFDTDQPDKGLTGPTTDVNVAPGMNTPPESQQQLSSPAFSTSELQSVPQMGSGVPAPSTSSQRQAPRQGLRAQMGWGRSSVRPGFYKPGWASK